MAMGSGKFRSVLLSAVHGPHHVLGTKVVAADHHRPAPDRGAQGLAIRSTSAVRS
ncbi:hypothetical protein ACFYNO_39765 [Kitasatospora sp. NPDC006697]|uniref:hypothetical protein n=1 Tax=Kitasatospora sp. NPDC006697 TaxID=3364020 RepID=UPI00368CFE48